MDQDYDRNARCAQYDAGMVCKETASQDIHPLSISMEARSITGMEIVGSHAGGLSFSPASGNCPAFCRSYTCH